MVEFLSSDVGLASIGERPKLSRGGYAAGASFDREGADSGEVNTVDCHERSAVSCCGRRTRGSICGGSWGNKTRTQKEMSWDAPVSRHKARGENATLGVHLR